MPNTTKIGSHLLHRPWLPPPQRGDSALQSQHLPPGSSPWRPHNFTASQIAAHLSPAVCLAGRWAWKGAYSSHSGCAWPGPMADLVPSSLKGPLSRTDSRQGLWGSSGHVMFLPPHRNNSANPYMSTVTVQVNSLWGNN